MSTDGGSRVDAKGVLELGIVGGSVAGYSWGFCCWVQMRVLLLPEIGDQSMLVLGPPTSTGVLGHHTNAGDSSEVWLIQDKRRVFNMHAFTSFDL